jgi:hypothetical protein
MLTAPIIGNGVLEEAEKAPEKREPRTTYSLAIDHTGRFA